MTKRDEFSEVTKRHLGNRVAWICSWPNCNAVTIGPGKTSTKDVIKLGDAAHIHAAAEGGPRFKSEMSPAERKSIDNGIWMCQRHARLIDADFEQYSPDTLREWKIDAENAAYTALCLPGALPLKDSSTLIQIGKDIIFYGKWIAAQDNKWTVSVESYIYGDEYLLKEYCSQYDTSTDQYIVIQAQGDGRIIKDVPSWEKPNRELRLTVIIGGKHVRRNPHDNGVDIALSPNKDIFLDENDDIAVVRGIDSAKQQIENILSTGFGEILFSPKSGSLFRQYFMDHKDDKILLSALLKLEVARLSSFPQEGREKSPLGFVNRVIEANFESIIDLDGRIDIMLALEWGNGEITKDRYTVFVGETISREI